MVLCRMWIIGVDSASIPNPFGADPRSTGDVNATAGSECKFGGALCLAGPQPSEKSFVGSRRTPTADPPPEGGSYTHPPRPDPS